MPPTRHLIAVFLCATNVPLAAQTTPDKAVTVRGQVFEDGGELASDAALEFAPVTTRSRVAPTLADLREDGSFEVPDLPTRLTRITRKELWTRAGVSRLTILPRPGLSVSLGGQHTVTGSLRFGGRPAAEVQLLLADEIPYDGSMRAGTYTDKHGRFTFSGPPAGVWTLYFDDGPPGRPQWLPIRKLELHGRSQQIGEIDVKTGTIQIQLAGRAEGDRLAVNIASLSNGTSQPYRIVRCKAGDGPTVVEDVPAGMYEVTCRFRPLRFRKVIKVTEGKTETVEFGLPMMSGSVSGVVQDRCIGRGTALLLRSTAGHELLVRLMADGNFQVDNIPPGHWSVHEFDDRQDERPRFEFDLVAGESKRLVLDHQNVRALKHPRGYVSVYTHLPNGILVPCRLTLSGNDGELLSRGTRGGEAWFIGPAGDYTLTVRLKGHPPLKRAVQLVPLAARGRLSSEIETHVFLSDR